MWLCTLCIINQLLFFSNLNFIFYWVIVKFSAFDSDGVVIFIYFFFCFHFLNGARSTSLGLPFPFPLCCCWSWPTSVLNIPHRPANAIYLVKTTRLAWTKTLIAIAIDAPWKIESFNRNDQHVTNKSLPPRRLRSNELGSLLILTNQTR